MAPVVVFAPPTVDLGALGPSLILTVAAVLVLLVGLFVSERGRGLLAGISLVGLIAALVAAVVGGRPGAVSVNDMLVLDGFAAFFGVIILVVAAITLILAGDYVARQALSLGEFYALLLFCCAGMMLLVGAADLIMILLGIEILSIALYVLSGFTRGRPSSEEAAMKYFLLGAFSLSFLIFGTAFVFGVTGSTRLSLIAAALAPRAPTSLLDNPLLLGGVGLILVGFAFKLSFAPFHMWTPDAYEGAPTPITAFMSVATKAAVFAALLRFLTFAVPSLRPEWSAVLWALAVLTMVIGNTAAVIQTRVKRMLAYSSIGQAGYILVGVIAGDAFGGPSVMFYLLAYAFMNLGAFAVLMALGEPGDADPEIADLNGLAARQPLLALAMTVFMLSLAGIPLTAGFIAKLYVFTAGVRAGYVDLVVIGVLTSAIATFYYLRIVVAMYMRPVEAATLPLRMSGTLSALLVVLLVATVALGVLPAGPLGFAAAAAAIR
ncbi:MAG TPA: NADH-quinone oxidoreductase subunit N [Chloroflexota bacterium]|nr:NADH-quinone oxidoreductase subunit N [Chloroflexota bacterium]